jgi:hypothetical protein
MVCFPLLYSKEYAVLFILILCHSYSHGHIYLRRYLAARTKSLHLSLSSNLSGSPFTCLHHFCPFRISHYNLFRIVIFLSSQNVRGKGGTCPWWQILGGGRFLRASKLKKLIKTNFK